MKDYEYYKNNFCNLTFAELQTYYWMLIRQCAEKRVNGEDFSEQNNELMAASNAITMINFSNECKKIENNMQSSR